MPNPFVFTDRRQGTSKTVDLFMALGMDTRIEPLLEEWRMDLSERRIETRKKKTVPTM